MYFRISLRVLSGGVRDAMYTDLPRPLVSKTGFQGCFASFETNSELLDPVKHALVPSPLVEEGCEGTYFRASHSCMHTSSQNDLSPCRICGVRVGIGQGRRRQVHVPAGQAAGHQQRPPLARFHHAQHRRRPRQDRQPPRLGPRLHSARNSTHICQG